MVITILAILGTIAFISLQGYSREARDAKRIQDIRSLMTKLNVENVKGTPYREMLVGGQIHHVKINGNAEEVYQGYIDFEYLRENRDNFLDPSTNRDYEFATSEGTTRYNNEDQRFNFIEGRYKSEKTNEEVILGNYYKYQDEDAENLFTGSINPYEGPQGITEVPNGLCADCKNIIIKDGNGNGYTIMDRNLGASEAGTDGTNTDIGGCYFQWGNNTCRDSVNTLTPIYPTTIDVSSYGNGKFFTDSNSVPSRTLDDPYDWVINGNNDLWGDLTKTNIARKGPCPTGYHVPTADEWIGLMALGFENNLWGVTPAWTNKGVYYSYTGYPTDMMNLLKLPLFGRRNRLDGTIDLQGTFGPYWSSTSNGTSAQFFRFNDNAVSPNLTSARATGSPVRCFKN